MNLNTAVTIVNAMQENTTLFKIIGKLHLMGYKLHMMHDFCVVAEKNDVLEQVINADTGALLYMDSMRSDALDYHWRVGNTYIWLPTENED